jgi:hypothetical protein
MIENQEFLESPSSPLSKAFNLEGESTGLMSSGVFDGEKMKSECKKGGKSGGREKPSLKSGSVKRHSDLEKSKNRKLYEKNAGCESDVTNRENKDILNILFDKFEESLQSNQYFNIHDPSLSETQSPLSAFHKLQPPTKATFQNGIILFIPGLLISSIVFQRSFYHKFLQLRKK